jgi:hypothetical protein
VISQAAVETAVGTYLAGVPFLAMPCTEGDMNMLFVKGLDTPEMHLQVNESPEALPQIIVWYPNKNYRGYVLFTWAACDATASKAYTDAVVANEASIRISYDNKELSARTAEDTNLQNQINALNSGLSGVVTKAYVDSQDLIW